MACDNDDSPPMRALILSDIHANLEALEAVLAATEGKWDELWNLGDVVGYGASPNQVIERIRPLAVLNVRGNHDRACCGLTSPNSFNPVARTAALWTRAQLSEENLTWLRELPEGPVQPMLNGVSCVHGSPVHEDHYILTMRDAWVPLNTGKDPVVLFGHTHLQGGFRRLGSHWQEVRPAASYAEPRNQVAPRNATPATPSSSTLPILADGRYLLNPGSVGQPRDADWRAAYALYDSDAAEIEFHRVPYDILGAQGRILMAELPERLAMRLREGR